MVDVPVSEVTEEEELRPRKHTLSVGLKLKIIAALDGGMPRSDVGDKVQGDSIDCEQDCQVERGVGAC